MDNFKTEIAKLLELNTDCSDADILKAIGKIKDDDEMLNLALDNMVDSFSIADGEGRFIRVNETFAILSGISREEMEGKPTQEMVESGRYGPTSAIMLAIAEKRRVVLYQDGVGKSAVSISTPIFDENGNIKYVVSSGRFAAEMKKLISMADELERENETSRAGKKLIWKSDRMKDIHSLAMTVAPTDTSILITGETGTGKSVLARYIHDNSKRRDKEFVEINCAAIPEALMESELFGYEGGAFTGASAKGKKGLFSIADGGTLFLDEIGDMPLNLQAKLLQTLQNRTFTRIGGEKPIGFDVRLITATNMDLEEMVKEGKFREELYYRINVVPIHLPALRERKDSLPDTISSVLARLNEQFGKSVVLSSSAEASLCDYEWPGNIRELENTIERLIVTNRTGVVLEEDLPARISAAGQASGKGIHVNDIMPLKEAMEELERRMIKIAYEKSRSSYKVAELLDISQSAASRKIIKYIRDEKKDQ